MLKAMKLYALNGWILWYEYLNKQLTTNKSPQMSISTSNVFPKISDQYNSTAPGVSDFEP